MRLTSRQAKSMVLLAPLLVVAGVATFLTVRGLQAGGPGQTDILIPACQELLEDSRRGLPAEKTAAVERECARAKARLEASGSVLPPKGPAPSRPPFLRTPAPLPPCDQWTPSAGVQGCVLYGVLEDREPPVGFKDTYGVNNIWAGKDILIFAGWLKDDPGQGVMVVTERFSSSARRVGEYRTPSKAGGLRITDAQGDVLTIAANDRATFQFDAASLQSTPPDALFLAPSPPPQPTPTPTSTVNLPPIARVAIDAERGQGTANTATSLGPLDACGAVAAGKTADIDVTVDAVPAVAGANGGVTAFQFVLGYDPKLVTVVALDPAMLLAGKPTFYPINMSDATPDSDGKFVVGVADFGDRSQPISGPGVLARITLRGVGTGVSPLTLSDVKIVDKSNSPYTISEVLPARVAVDTPCP